MSGPTSRYVLPPYNGFSPAERRAVTPIQNAAIRDGRLVRPTTCCICGFSDPANPKGRGYIYLHNEDYRQELVIYPLCKRHHADLHARFKDPARWARVIREYGRPGSWILALSLDPASQWQPFDVTYPKGVRPPSALVE